MNTRVTKSAIRLTAAGAIVALSALSALPAKAAPNQVAPLILMPVPEAPHGIPRGHVAAIKRHQLQLASVQSATQAALAALPLIDTSFLGKALQDTLETRAAENAKDQDLAEAVHFYTSRDFAPAWTLHGKLTVQARKVIGRLRDAHLDGLDPAEYDTGITDPETARFSSLEEAIDLEIALTSAVSRYVRHAAMGRINPRSVSRNITIAPQRPDIAAALVEISTGSTPIRSLDAYHPAHDGFRQLRDALARTYVSEDSGVEKVEIPSGKLIKPGQSDKRIPLLRARLGIEAPAGDANVYDDELAQAVIKLQKKHGLPSQGFVGNLTLGVLNGHSTGSRSDILVNMERWRWTPRDLGDYHVHVNIPEYLVRIVSAGDVVHTTRVVVGKTRNQTPVFSDEIEHIVVNPTWSVPRSIATKEYLPRLQQDPTYLQRRNIQVLGRGGRVIDPTSVDWASYSRRSMPYRFRQPSGRGNALGNVKFMFPNEHSVYLHDTQSRSLFSRTTRAYSHGCVRVHKPFKFADALLRLEADWTGKRLKSLVGRRGERTVKLKTHIPVHLTYFTAIAGDDGSVRKLRDIYGHDRRMKTMMGL